jgi:membrane protease YdiL (CAAX protease family)
VTPPPVPEKRPWQERPLTQIVAVPVGQVSAAAIALLGFGYGWFYMRFGRVWPMIIGHALYDSFQVIQVVVAFRGG